MPLGTAALLGAGLGAVGGAAKSGANQSKKDKALQLAAETARYSPWTHMNANQAIGQAQGMEGANYLGDVTGGGFAGGLTGSNVDSAWSKMNTPNMAPSMTPYEPTNTLYDPKTPLAQQMTFSKKSQGFNPYQA